MKKVLLLKVLVLSFLFPLHNVQASEMEQLLDNHSYTYYEEKIEDEIEKITLDFVNENVVVVEGEENGIQFLTQEEYTGEFTNRYDLSINGSSIELNSTMGNNALIVITLSDTEAVELEIKSLSGDIFVQHNLSNLDLKTTNSNLYIKNIATYPMNLELVNGLVDIDIDEWNHNVKLLQSNNQVEIINGDNEGIVINSLYGEIRIHNKK